VIVGREFLGLSTESLQLFGSHDAKVPNNGNLENCRRPPEIVESITKFLILPMNELIGVEISFVLTPVRISEFCDELLVDLCAVSLKPKRAEFTKDSPV
jgi:hypothetical protein